MTTRRLRDLPQQWAEPIFELLTLTRDATRPTEPPALLEAWVAATTAVHRPRTGYRTARRTAEAGTYAAHVLVRNASRRTGGYAPAWPQALADVPLTAINSWGPERTEAARALDASVARLGDLEYIEALPARLVAR